MLCQISWVELSLLSWFHIMNLMIFIYTRLSIHLAIYGDFYGIAYPLCSILDVGNCGIKLTIASVAINWSYQKTNMCHADYTRKLESCINKSMMMTIYGRI